MFLKNCPYSNFLSRHLQLQFFGHCTQADPGRPQTLLFTSVTSFDVLKVKSRLHDFLQTIFFVWRSVNGRSKFKLKSIQVIPNINVFTTLNCVVLQLILPSHLFFFQSRLTEAADLSSTDTTWSEGCNKHIRAKKCTTNKFCLTTALLTKSVTHHMTWKIEKQVFLSRKM